jgi:hypothetical protein
MENNLIQIEKGKYTALLRRVLGMEVSENGVSEVSAILNVIKTSAHNGSYYSDRVYIDACFETIEFALEYYHLRKDDLYSPIKEVGKIDLRKSVNDDTFG